MKLTYIIVPSADTGHLVRCVNSLYRQDDKNFDVILAENVFGSGGGEIEKYIGGIGGLKRISGKAEGYKEKIKEAISMIDKDSDYVMFVDISSVTSPICSRTLCRYQGPDIIMPLTAKKENDEFVTDKPSLYEIVRQIDKYDPAAFCFKFSLIKDMPVDLFTDRGKFSIFMLSLFMTLDQLPVTDDICFYTDKRDNGGKIKLTVESVAQSENLIIEKFAETKNAAIKTAVFEKLFQDIAGLYSEGETAQRKEAFKLMQTLCVGVSEDVLLKKIFELKAGCDTDVFLKLFYDEYEIYRDRVFAFASERYIPQINISEFEKSIIDVNSGLNKINKEIADMKKSMTALAKSKQAQNMQAGRTALVYNDPLSEIPALYSQGRLGFKVIWRSFKAWLGYKFSRKK